MLVPPVLASDPWPKLRVRPVLELTLIEHAAIAWPKGERERILKETRVVAHEDVIAKAPDPHAYALELLLAKGTVPIQAGQYVELADLPTLARGGVGCGFVEHYRLVHLPLAKRGLDALPTLFEVFNAWPENVLGALCFADATAVGTFLLEQAFQYEGAFLHWASARPKSAALVLLPFALGPKGKRRDAAVKLLLDMRGAPPRPRRLGARPAFEHDSEAAMRAAAVQYGEQASAELDILFAPPPLPSKAPKLPAFVNLDALPSPKLVDGSVVPPEAKRRLVQLAVLLPAHAAREALDSAIPSLDRDSLAELAEGVLAAWSQADAPVKERWVFFLSALFGDDRAVRKLAARAQAWSAEGYPARGKLALEAMSAIGSDVALMHLSFVARGKSTLKKPAEKLLQRFGKEHGLTIDEVADRTVPDLGLDERGTLLLDYGARSFRVGFDEQLRPFVLDNEGGAQLTSLPRVTKADDAAKAAAAQELWKALKSETKSLGAEQMRRLERAMVAGRLWSVDGFRRYFLEHPLMRHVARRLVWGTFEPGKRRQLVTPFRIAEDGTFADGDDDAFVLAEDSAVGLVHPLLVSTEMRQRFGATFTDYGIVQPFSQLGRELHFPTDEERSASATSRYVGKVARGERFFALRHRGWHLSGDDIAKPVGRPFEAVIRTEPGLDFLGGKPEDQTLGEVELQQVASFEPEPGKEVRVRTFGELSPVIASELFRDLDSLLR